MGSSTMTNVNAEEEARILAALSTATGRWLHSGTAATLAAWLRRELDREFVPKRLLVSDWSRCLEILGEARRQAGEWPEGLNEPITGFVRAALRFTRPGRHPVFSAATAGADGPTWPTAEWADWHRESGIARVVRWWTEPARPARGARMSSRIAEVSPPLPAWSAADRVLAVLRPDWRTDGDFLAVDHRDARSPCRLELQGGGRTWLGAEWEGSAAHPASEEATAARRVRPACWITGSSADLLEWTTRRGGLRVTWSALLLRGRRLALLSTQVERRGQAWASDPALRVSLPGEISAAPVKGSRCLALTETGRRGAAIVLPIGLPCLPYPTDRGSFRESGGELIVRQAPAGRRVWTPLLVSWDQERHRKALSWRVLTVSEQARIVGPDRAFAVRVSWGRDETYVIYRSVGPPARRAFLGHQTTVRFLVATFNERGELRPILTVE